MRMPPFKSRANEMDIASTVCEVLTEQALLHRHEPGFLIKQVKYLHQRTGGLISSLSHIIRAAAIYAIVEGCEQITRTCSMSSWSTMHRVRRTQTTSPPRDADVSVTAINHLSFSSTPHRAGSSRPELPTTTATSRPPTGEKDQTVPGQRHRSDNQNEDLHHCHAALDVGRPADGGQIGQDSRRQAASQNIHS
jgi:hypothetical protein